ncbi:MAG TPA: hypothetical protein VFU28_20335 [Vicinamibacterales bacterium]|nr:hypothetical protein [Vicinamibacterales bacterium]
MILRLVLVVTIAFAAAEAAAQSTLQLRGSWRATAGTRIFQGTWTADANPKTPNLAQGSWTLIEGTRVLLRGTWAAEKERAGWRGAWSALVASAPPGAPPMTGTWQANVKDSAGDTLSDMLERVAQAQIDGTWRSGRMAGSWSLVR